jgi:tetratricopeptide (TPR) repeat protein
MRSRLPAFLIILSLLAWSCHTKDKTEVSEQPGSGASIESLSSVELQKAVDRFPDSPALRMRLIASLEKEGRIQPALDLLDQMIATDSLSAFLYYRKAQLQVAGADSSGAIISLNKAAFLDPERASIQLELGSLYADRRDARLLPLADTLIARSPDPDVQSRALLLKGVYYANLGDRNKAIHQYDESILRNYTFLDAFIEKGIAQYEMGKFGEALKTFEKGLTIKPSEAELYLWKGKCHQALGQRAEAMDNFRKCLGLDGGLKEAATLLSALERDK